jgi:hypothetical protein
MEEIGTRRPTAKMAERSAWRFFMANPAGDAMTTPDEA